MKGEDVSAEAYRKGTFWLWLVLNAAMKSFGLYFMGLEQLVANAIQKILDHMCSISKAK